MILPFPKPPLTGKLFNILIFVQQRGEPGEDPSPGRDSRAPPNPSSVEEDLHRGGGHLLDGGDDRAVAGNCRAQEEVWGLPVLG